VKIPEAVGIRIAWVKHPTTSCTFILYQTPFVTPIELSKIILPSPFCACTTARTTQIAASLKVGNDVILRYIGVERKSEEEFRIRPTSIH
jgi:hypothetical protein